MKKILFSFAFAGLSSAFALTNLEIIAFYEDMLRLQVPNIKVSVAKREKIDKHYERVELSIRAGSEEMRELLFVRDDYIFPDIIDVGAEKSYRADFEEQRRSAAKAEFDKKVKAVLKDEPHKIAIGDNKKPVMYVFSDPECPYCRQQLENVENDLKKYQVVYVLTTVHGESALQKVAQIYTEIASAKTDSQKLAIMRKYYAPNAATPKAPKKAYEEAVKIYEKYAKLGLRSVPTFVLE